MIASKLLDHGPEVGAMSVLASYLYDPENKGCTAMIYKYEINIIVYPVQFSHTDDSITHETTVCFCLYTVLLGTPKEFWEM